MYDSCAITSVSLQQRFLSVFVLINSRDIVVNHDEEHAMNNAKLICGSTVYLQNRCCMRRLLHWRKTVLLLDGLGGLLHRQ